VLKIKQVLLDSFESQHDLAEVIKQLDWTKFAIVFGYRMPDSMLPQRGNAERKE